MDSKPQDERNIQLVGSVRAPVSYVCKSGTRMATSRQYDLLVTRHIITISLVDA